MNIEYRINHNLLNADGRRFLRDVLDNIAIASHLDQTIRCEYLTVSEEDMMFYVLQNGFAPASQYPGITQHKG
jgi:hypothetical protein